MHEVELKSVVNDLLLRRLKVERAGGRLSFEGTMEDWYFTHASEPGDSEQRLRIRAYRTSGRAWTELTWKGPAHQVNGYKVCEELTTQVDDEGRLREILEQTGFSESESLWREVAWYVLGDATLRFERFPYMDLLLEVEGSPMGIERAIRATGILRERFTADSRQEFIRRFEERTGMKAVLARLPPSCELVQDRGLLKRQRP